MHNFKIAHANLKDPNISSLRMNHFKIAHISTWLATGPSSLTQKITQRQAPVKTNKWRLKITYRIF